MRGLTTDARRALVGAAIAGLALTAACSGARDSIPRARTKVRVASQFYLGNVPLLVGVNDSIFATHGIDVEIVTLGPSDALPLLVSGQIDAINGMLSPGALNAMADGQPIRIVAARNYFDANRCTSLSIMVNPNGPKHKASQWSISVDKDLSMRYVVEAALPHLGVKMDTMEVVNIPPAAELEALANGSLDYALTGEPWATRAAESGNVQWTSIDSLLPGVQFGHIVFGPSILQKNRELGQRFMVAYLDAVARYSEGPTPRNVEIIAAVTGEKPELVKKACWPSQSSDGRLRLQDIEDEQRWALAHGYIKKAATAEQFWDSSFVSAVKPSSTR